MEQRVARTHQVGGYKPISDYGVIGNLRTAVLVGRDGSIDWCCLPHLDRPSVFAALLDARRGGRFQVWLPQAGAGEQAYLGETNILRTVFRDSQGELSVTDLMPLSGDIEGCGGSQGAPEIHRLLECWAGGLRAVAEWAPRFDYGRSETRIERRGATWVASGGGEAMSLAGLPQGVLEDDGTGPVVRATLDLEPGQQLPLVARWGHTDVADRDRAADLEACLQTLDETRRTWRSWAQREGLVEKRVWAGDWQGMVTRSALAFKLLTHADTGAIAAAATTSLPGDIGGVRNWDYRFTWLRDASLTAQALISLGHEKEAVDLLYWTERAAESGNEETAQDGLQLQIMYGLHGERDLTESILDHLEGYRGSRPVRIGNEAAEQFQLETYGELLNTAYEIARRGHEIPRRTQRFLSAVADHVCRVWERPDKGIWEMRGEPRHFVYSKVMAWVALDKAMLLAERNGFRGDVDTWRRTRERIKRQVLVRGFSERLGAFVQSYDSEDLDASNLRFPLVEFLPFDDPRMVSTVDRTLEQLTENGLVYRYTGDDGLPGQDGPFGLCTFWLVDFLAMSGRVDRAREIFDGMAKRANHVGLYSEQINPRTGEFQGNFPQAYTHLGLINSAIYLAYAEGREVPEHAPVGTAEHRERARRDGARVSR